jgi:hypothetical protein
MGLLARWRAERELRRRAVAYTRALLTEPADTDVAWLAGQGTAGDADHARWELRYARRALGLLSARRDALDDRTGSVVARELGEAFVDDPRIDRRKREVAERQLNARLRAYGDALDDRAEGTRARLGRALFSFAAPGRVPSEEDAARAGDILAAYLLDANDELRRTFGAASLPDHLPPSALQGSG